MNEFLWLLWIFSAAIVVGAAIALVAYAAAIAEGVYLDTRAAYRRRRRKARAARIEQRIAAGTHDVERDLYSALAARAVPTPLSADVLRFERTRGGLMAVADATHEERDR